MKYTLRDRTLELAAESIRDSALLADHFETLKLGQIHYADPAKMKANLARMAETLKAVEMGDLIYQDEATEKRPWFAVSAELGADAIQPYLALLKRITGYAGELPDLEFIPANAGLIHTHILAKCVVSSRGIHAEGYIRSEDWNGKLAAERAKIDFYDYILGGFGYRPSESEFIGTESGLYRRNPKYPTRQAAQAGLGSPELWSCIFAWWRDNHATPGQEAVLQFADRSKQRFGLQDNDWNIRHGGGNQANLVGSSGIYLAYSGANATHMKWDEFAALTEWAPIPEPWRMIQ